VSRPDQITANAQHTAYGIFCKRRTANNNALQILQNDHGKE
jgi:hypothetical protein